MKKEKLNLSTLGFKEMTKAQLHKINGGDIHHLTPSKGKGSGGGGVDPYVFWIITH